MYWTHILSFIADMLYMRRTCKRCVTTNFFFTHQQQQKGVCVFRPWTQLQVFNWERGQLSLNFVRQSLNAAWCSGSVRLSAVILKWAWSDIIHEREWKFQLTRVSALCGAACGSSRPPDGPERWVRPFVIVVTDPGLKRCSEDLRRLQCSAWI